MFRIVLVRPGATSFDEQGRIKGCLDIPLSKTGSDQAIKTASELSGLQVDMVYSAPCESAQQTAEIVAKKCRSRMKVVDALRNLDHGLWQGKLIDEVRRQQPKVYRQCQESPENVCPPVAKLSKWREAAFERCSTNGSTNTTLDWLPWSYPNRWRAW